MQTENPILRLGDCPVVKVRSAEQLQGALLGLSNLERGQLAVLERGPKNYIKATCNRELWSIVVRREGMWWPQSFTPNMTSEYSERRVRESRAQESIRGRLRWWLDSPPASGALSQSQARTVFTEYLLDRPFTIPLLGA